MLTKSKKCSKVGKTLRKNNKLLKYGCTKAVQGPCFLGGTTFERGCFAYTGVNGPYMGHTAALQRKLGSYSNSFTIGIGTFSGRTSGCFILEFQNFIKPYFTLDNLFPILLFSSFDYLVL